VCIPDLDKSVLIVQSPFLKRNYVNKTPMDLDVLAVCLCALSHTDCFLLAVLLIYSGDYVVQENWNWMTEDRHTTQGE
jgi:hypothetical protein